MVRILHLSDLHFGKSHFFRQTPGDLASPTLATAIGEALKLLPPGQANFDVTVLSGDLFSIDPVKDCVQAKPILHELKKLKPLKDSEFFCVPGNHDLTWDKDFRDKPFQFYDETVRDLKMPEFEKAKFPVVRTYPSGDGVTRDLAFVALDSSILESEIAAGFGRVGEEQLQSFRSQMKARKISPDTHIIIAIIHHHLLQVFSEEPVWDPDNPQGTAPGPHSFTVDSKAILNDLADCGVAVLLHGHQHKPVALCYQDLNRGLPVYILGAGSCGSKPVEANLPRHFYVYEVDNVSLTARSFVESPANYRRFELSNKVAHISLTPPGNGDACGAANRVVFLKLGKDDREVSWGDDQSNLVVMMLSVVNCEQARKSIRQIVSTLEQSDFWKKTKPQYFQLLDMYDLMGKWDLVVRMRIDPNVNSNRLRRFFTTELERAGAVEPAEDRKKASGYTEVKVFDITHEFDRLGKIHDDPIVIPRTKLNNTDQYETQKCQRAIICLRLPESEAMTSQLISAVQAYFNRNAYASEIVEAFSKCEEYLFIDTFMTCDKTWRINRLNRELEKPLTENGKCQKYTLICYGYDESSIDVGSPPEFPKINNRSS